MLFSTKNLAIQGPSKLTACYVGHFYVICRIGLCYLQDRTLSLQIKPTFKSLTLSCLPCTPAEAIISVTGITIAFGHWHSTTTPTEASFKKEAQKVQKKKKIKIKSFVIMKVNICLKFNAF